MATKGTKNTKEISADIGSTQAIGPFLCFVPFVFFVAPFLSDLLRWKA
jgi:hypothetical protein